MRKSANQWHLHFRPGHKDDHHDDDHHEEPPRPEVEDIKSEEEKPKPKPASASIFGKARPVDTTAREKEIEERLRKKSEEKEPDQKNGERY